MSDSSSLGNAFFELNFTYATYLDRFSSDREKISQIVLLGQSFDVGTYRDSLEL